MIGLRIWLEYDLISAVNVNQSQGSSIFKLGDQFIDYYNYNNLDYYLRNLKFIRAYYDYDIAFHMDYRYNIIYSLLFY